MKRILSVFGTRPEASSFARSCGNCALEGQYDVKVCATAQHRDMLDQVLEVTPHYDLNVMEPGQTLTALSAEILAALELVLDRERPALVIVQGDTTTTLAVAHELRTGTMTQPFPEEHPPARETFWICCDRLRHRRPPPVYPSFARPPILWHPGRVRSLTV